MTPQQTALDALQKLYDGFGDDARIAQEKQAQLQIAITLLTTGYQSDIEAAKALLQPEIDQLTATAERLQANNDDLTTQLTAASGTIETLQTAMGDAVDAPAPAISAAVG